LSLLSWEHPPCLAFFVLPLHQADLIGWWEKEARIEQSSFFTSKEIVKNADILEKTLEGV